MRIVCDNCGAKYQISDDKVRNKVFKIRCKKCSHTIVVRSKGDAAAASGESNDDATRVAPAPAGDPMGSIEAAAPDAIWYVVVNREQVGPLSSAEVERRFQAGEIDGDCFTWAEGMADWIRLSTVTEFSHLFPAPCAVRAAAAPAAPKGLFPKEEPDEDVMVSNNEAPSEAASADRLFGAADDEEPELRSPRVEAGHRLRSQRNENSVLFSLDSMGVDDAPRVSSTGGSEGSGLIDISAMMGGGSSAPSASADSFGGPIGIAPTAPAPLMGGPLPSLVTRKKSNTGLIIGIVAGAVIVAGGIVAAVVLKGGGTETPIDSTPAVVAAGNTQKAGVPASAAPAQSAAPSSEAVAAATAPGSTPAPVSVAMANTPSGGGRVAPGGGARGGAAPAPRGNPGGPRVAGGASDDDAPRAGGPAPTPPRPAAPATEAPAKPKKGGDEVDDILGRLSGGGKPAGGAARPAGGPAAPAADPLLPEQLTKAQILSVVKGKAGAISNCKDRQPDASGTVMVSMKIEKSGRVGNASAKPPFAGTPVGNCVESTVRGFQFPQFSGDSMSINMPFAL